MVKTGIRCLGSLQLSFHYQEQRKCLKASLIMRHRQNCWGGTGGSEVARRPVILGKAYR